MKNEERLFSVVITKDNFLSKVDVGYIEDIRNLLSDISRALGLYSWKEADIDALDHVSDSCSALIEAYNWTTYTRDLLNGLVDDCKARDFMNKWQDADPTELIARARASEYLLGDYLDIEQNMLSDATKYVKATMTDKLTEVIPFNPEAEDAPPDLLKDLARLADSVYEEAWDEYAKRTRRAIRDYYGSETISYNRGNNTVTLVFTEDQAREQLGYSVADDEPLEADALTTYILSDLIAKTNEYRIQRATARTALIASSKERQAEERRAKEAKIKAAKLRKKEAGN